MAKYKMYSFALLGYLIVGMLTGDAVAHENTKYIGWIIFGNLAGAVGVATCLVIATRTKNPTRLSMIQLIILSLIVWLVGAFLGAWAYYFTR